MTKRYIFPEWNGQRHGASGREADPPKADWFDETFASNETLKQIESEAEKYLSAYDRAVMNRIANNTKARDKDD